MMRMNLLLVVVLLAIPLVGCGSGGSGNVADPDDIAEYVANNPQSDSATEPEGGDL